MSYNTVPTTKLNQRLGEDYRASLRPDVHTFQQIDCLIEEVFDPDKIQKLAKESALPDDLARALNGVGDRIYARVATPGGNFVLPFEDSAAHVLLVYGNAHALVNRRGIIRYRNQNIESGAITPRGSQRPLARLIKKLVIWNLAGTS